MGYFGAYFGGGGKNVISPSFVIVSPDPSTTPGAPGGFPEDYATAKDTPIIITVTDADPGMTYTGVVRVMPDGSRSLVFGGAGVFYYPYNIGSSAASLGDTYTQLTIRYNGGWPPDTFVHGIEFELVAIDGDGNKEEA